MSGSVVDVFGRFWGMSELREAFSGVLGPELKEVYGVRPQFSGVGLFVGCKVCTGG
jgi:hypothetical protein